MVRRTHAIVLGAVGIAAVMAGLTGVAPGSVAYLGGSLAFFGLVLVGLSFVPRPTPTPDAPPPLSPFDRIAGLFHEPTRVFQNLRAHPRWLAALLILALANFIYTTAFTQRVTPERIVDFTTEKVVEAGFIPAERAVEMREQQIAAAKDPVRRWGGVVSTVVFTFCVLAIIAALYLLGIVAFGGRMNFWQALAVSTHAALPVVVISSLLSLLLLYLKDPADLHPVIDANGLVRDNLGVLFSPAAHPVLYAAAASLGALSFYGLWLAATGLKNAGERVSPSAAWSVAIAIWVVGLIIRVAMAAAFGSFMS